MKQLLAGLLFMFSFAIGASAQSTVPVTVPSYDSGPASYMHPNFYSIPVTVGGVTSTMWMYPQPCNVNGVCGFLLFRPTTEGSGYYFADITAWFANSYNSIGQVSSATLNYTVKADPNGDGDTDTVMGSIVFTFTYNYVKPGCYGRYCVGWHETLSGTGQQSITQD